MGMGDKNSTRYPYTYACDLIRSYGGYGEKGTNLSRSNASQIREMMAEVLGIDDRILAEKLADHYLKTEDTVTEKCVREFNQAQEYHQRMRKEGYE